MYSRAEENEARTGSGRRTDQNRTRGYQSLHQSLQDQVNNKSEATDDAENYDEIILSGAQTREDDYKEADSPGVAERRSRDEPTYDELFLSDANQMTEDDQGSHSGSSARVDVDENM